MLCTLGGAWSFRLLQLLLRTTLNSTSVPNYPFVSISSLLERCITSSNTRNMLDKSWENSKFPYLLNSQMLIFEVTAVPDGCLNFLHLASHRRWRLWCWRWNRGVSRWAAIFGAWGHAVLLIGSKDGAARNLIPPGLVLEVLIRGSQKWCNTRSAAGTVPWMSFLLRSDGQLLVVDCICRTLIQLPTVLARGWHKTSQQSTSEGVCPKAGDFTIKI